MPTARQILKKILVGRILVGRILVRPVGPGAWRFAGISRYHGALRGDLGRVADLKPAYGPRYDDFCQLMLYLLAEPAGARDQPGGVAVRALHRAQAGASDRGRQRRPGPRGSDRVGSARGPQPNRRTYP